MGLKDDLIDAEKAFLDGVRGGDVDTLTIVADPKWYRKELAKKGVSFDESKLPPLIRCARAYVKSTLPNPEAIPNTRGHKTTTYNVISYPSNRVSSRTLIPLEGRVIWPFGIHKGSNNYYYVTHLPTGVLILGCQRLKNAKRLIELANEIPRSEFPFLFRPMGRMQLGLGRAIEKYYREMYS